VIGRAAHADWTLSDPNNHVSSIHCEVDYRDGRYFLTDRSTNGTFINGAAERLSRPVQLRDGDLLQIGHYQIRVEEVPDGAAATTSGAPAFGGGIDWNLGADQAAKPASTTKFGREPPRPLFQSAQDPLMNAFAAPAPRSDPFGVPPAAPDPFGIAPAARPAADPFGIAAPAPAPMPAPPPAPAASNPFGLTPSPIPSAPADPFGVNSAPPPPAPAPADPFGAADPFGMAVAAPATAPAPPPASDPWAMLSQVGAVAFAPVPTPAPAPAAPAPPAAAPAEAAPPASPAPATDGLYERLLAACGMERRDLGARRPEAVVDTIGQLLRQTADGLFKLLEARTRVRHQFGVGAQVTSFQRTGNNPLKWTRSPDQALKQMIGDPGAGFLEGTQAVRGAFEDLQAHELAMMAAMQEAMQATIRRFAPETIRKRVSAKGWLKSVLPGSREATLWRAYETEFTALADESEAAYLDLFAKEFKRAYERIVSATDQQG
jgi:type VI secretion system FHA domain protein